MDRSQARNLAQNELKVVLDAGYTVASEHIDTSTRREVCDGNGKSYALELSYHWAGEEHDSILVICTVTSKDWFSHQRLEESLTLQAEPQ